MCKAERRVGYNCSVENDATSAGSRISLACGFSNFDASLLLADLNALEWEMSVDDSGDMNMESDNGSDLDANVPEMYKMYSSAWVHGDMDESD